MRMFELVPVPVITDFLLVLFTKSLPFYAITFRKHTDTHRSRSGTAVYEIVCGIAVNKIVLTKV